MKKRFQRPVPGALIVLLIVLGWGTPAAADGGRVRFRRQAGPFVVTLFTTPDPLTQGPADFSVAVERAGAPGLVSAAHVDLILTPAANPRGQLILPMSHASATSKWLQAANFSIPASGVWHVTVRVRSGADSGECSGEVRVQPPGARDLTWDILPVPLVAFVLVMHQTLKQKYNRGRRNRRL
jgi:hypothetical protein